MRILILNDIHHGTTRASRFQPNIIRQNNSLSLKKLKQLVAELSSQDFDLVLQLGDLIKEVDDPEKNEQLLREALRALKQLPFPMLHLIGNHDLKAFSAPQATKFFAQEQHNASFFGVTRHNNLQIVRLDITTNDNHDAILAQEKLAELEKQLDSSKEALVFSHYPLVPFSGEGTFYFAKAGSEAWMTYKNNQEILDLFAPITVRAFINAHIHLAGYKQHRGQHFITAPAFAVNIAAEDYPKNNPAIYSVLDIDDQSLTLKSYSGDFVFSSIEI